MVVRIRTGKSIRGALNYNEQKVTSGKAEMILASGFGCEINFLGFTQKINRFERLNSKSQKTTTNTIHISLNFSPYDQINSEKMQAIASDYMNRIGFGGQPFLVYRHMDTNHPHMHIVAPVIKPNGRPINLHNIGLIKSEPARKAIENEFGLIPAESMKSEMKLHRAHETKQSITNTVNEVIRSYHFTSLDEFNLILRQHLVKADAGKPGSRLNLNKGLLYSNCDHDGNKVGISIKASSIYQSPTLKVLAEKFEKEGNRKHQYNEHTAVVMKEILNTPRRITEIQFKIRLAKEKIRCYFEKDENGEITDIKFVDNLKKVVLSCNELNLAPELILNKIIPSPEFLYKTIKSPVSKGMGINAKQTVILSNIAIKLLQSLTAPEYDQSSQTPEFLKKKKKKRKPRY